MKGKKWIVGARKRRLLACLFSFFALAVCYSIEFGTGDSGFPICTVTVLLIVLVPFVLSYRARREEKRAQLALEALEEQPRATPEEFCDAFLLARRRQLRMEALLCLLFTAVTALLSLILLLAGAKPTSWVIGSSVLTPGFLLLSAGLYLASNLIREDEGDKALYYDIPQEVRDELREERPDHRREAPIQLRFQLDTVPDRQTVCDLVYPRLRRMRWAVRIAEAFFLWIPLILCLFLCVLAASGQGFMLVCAFFLLLLSIPTGVAARGLNGGSAVKKWIRNLKQGETRLGKDRVLDLGRCRWDRTQLEICLEQAGRWQIVGSVLKAGELKEALLGDVLVLSLGDGCPPILFFPETKSAFGGGNDTI